MRARVRRPRRMRWRPRLLSRTGTDLDVPAAALNFARPILIDPLLCPPEATLARPRFTVPGSSIVTVPLQPPEPAGQTTSTVATPEALTPTVCRGMVGGMELPAG